MFTLNISGCLKQRIADDNLFRLTRGVNKAQVQLQCLHRL